VRVLVTGMSGTGKSSALAELAKRGYRVVDTDEGGWCIWSEAEDGGLWDEERIAALLGDDGDGRTLFVSGCVSNQGRFYDRFDAVVLLSAPAEVAFERIETRTTNEYGKSPAERELVRLHFEMVEPLLRATATHELDATRPLDEVVEDLVALASR
jgi:adenylate kinase family enzyme